MAIVIPDLASQIAGGHHGRDDRLPSR